MASKASKNEILSEKQHSNESKANILYDIGMRYAEENELQKAIDSFEKALPILNSVYGENNEKSGDVCYNLAIFHAEQNKNSKAEEYFEKCLRIYRSLWGENHERIGDARNEFARFQLKRGEFEKAEFSFKRAIDIRTWVHNGQNDKLTETYMLLGSAYGSQGKNKEAIEQFEKALGIYTKQHGEHSVDGAMQMKSIGQVYRNDQQYEEAEKFYKRAHKSFSKALGGENQFSAEVLMDLGILHDMQNNYEEAVRYYNKGQEAFQKVFEPNHIKVAHAMLQIGNCYMKQGETEKAEGQYKETMRKLETTKEGKYSEENADSNMHLALIEVKRNNPEKAKHYFRIALDLYRQVFGKNHPRFAAVCFNLGKTLMELKDYQGAEEVLNEAIEAYMSLKSVNQRQRVSIPATFLLLGEAVEKQRKFREAFQCYDESFQLLRATKQSAGGKSAEGQEIFKETLNFGPNSEEKSQQNVIDEMLEKVELRMALMRLHL